MANSMDPIRSMYLYLLVCMYVAICDPMVISVRWQRNDRWDCRHLLAVSVRNESVNTNKRHHSIGSYLVDGSYISLLSRTIRFSRLFLSFFLSFCLFLSYWRVQFIWRILCSRMNLSKFTRLISIHSVHLPNPFAQFMFTNIYPFHILVYELNRFYESNNNYFVFKHKLSWYCLQVH